jgi:L-alanine-DL-glutamate epimerase-like enolase superfamily enzyme
MLRIEDVSAEPIDIALTEPFGIAGGEQTLARNVLVRVRLTDGTIGLGEAAPFPAVNGETQRDALLAIEAARPALVGSDGRRFRWLARSLSERTEVRSARCALETAILDALCRHAQLSLWTFFGGAEPTLESDITITTGSPDAASSAATRAIARGFRILKVKVGGAAAAWDRDRLRAIAQAVPRARLVLDANGSLSADAAIALVESARSVDIDVALFEQPAGAQDYDALREVRQRGRVRVAADESATCARDVVTLASEHAADVVNLKIMKSGVNESLDMAATARAHGLGLMIGGMVESKLAMTASACLAAGLGGFDFVDLDTPWWMTASPLRGGFVERGPVLDVSTLESGHGVSVAPR